MPSQPSLNEDLDERILLLHQAVALFAEELSTLSHRQWENLPDLKKKKVVLASRFRAVDWQSQPSEPHDLHSFKTQITELESQSRQKIQGQLELLGHQILAMQDIHQYWRESLSLSFGKYCAPAPAP